MNRLSKLGILFLIVAGVAWTAMAVSQSRQTVTVSQRARALDPGEIVELTVTAPPGTRALTALAFDQRFPGFFDARSGQWRALVGIDLRTSPGSYVVRLQGTSDSGEWEREHSLQVGEKTFPTRRLTVDEKFVNPPQSQLHRIRRESRRISAIFESITSQRHWEGRFVRPVTGPASSSFGKRSILNGKPRSPHSGTDFDADTGTPVYAPNRGTVALARNLYYSGNTVILDHGLGLYSFLAHLSDISVREGEKVETGRLVGRVGATGRVTGPHLHWSVRLNRTRVDPISLLFLLGENE